MAAIDKIYGTNQEYDEFHAWCAENKPDILKYFTPREAYRYEHNRSITNFPEWADKWLLKNCPISWVVARIKDQYGITDKKKKQYYHNKPRRR